MSDLSIYFFGVLTGASIMGAGMALAPLAMGSVFKVIRKGLDLFDQKLSDMESEKWECASCGSWINKNKPCPDCELEDSEWECPLCGEWVSGIYRECPLCRQDELRYGIL